MITPCDPVELCRWSRLCEFRLNFVISKAPRDGSEPPLLTAHAVLSYVSKAPKVKQGSPMPRTLPKYTQTVQHRTCNKQHKLRAWFGILHSGEVHRESLRVRSRPKLLLAHRLPPVHRRRPRHLRPPLRLHLGGAPRRAGVGAVLLTWLGLGLKGYRVIGLQGYRVAGLQGYRVRGLGPGSGFGLGFGPGLLLTNS